MFGCLKMYIDCSSNESANPIACASCFTFSLRENFWNTGSRSCSACPILLIDFSFLYFSVPSGLNAFSSKKNRILSPDVRKYSSATRLCSCVEKIETISLGSNSWTNSSALAVSYTHLRAHETPEHLVCRLLLEKKKK